MSRVQRPMGVLKVINWWRSKNPGLKINELRVKNKEVKIETLRRP